MSLRRTLLGEDNPWLLCYARSSVICLQTDTGIKPHFRCHTSNRMRLAIVNTHDKDSLLFSALEGSFQTDLVFSFVMQLTESRKRTKGY